MTRREEKDGVPLRANKREPHAIRAERALADEKQAHAKTRLELRKAYAQIGSLMVDGLTGIFNRAGLNTVLDKTLTSDTAAVIYIDLDKFKPINDTYGHDAGDRALEIVGKLLRDNIKSDIDIIAYLKCEENVDTRQKQAISSRIGGDEFVVVMDGLNEQSAQPILDRLQKKFDGLSFKWGKQDIKINASLGLAIYDSKSETFDDAKARADKDMMSRKVAKGHAPRR